MSDVVIAALIGSSGAVLATIPVMTMGLVTHGKLNSLKIEVDGKMSSLIESIRESARMQGVLEEKNRDKSGDASKRG